MTTVEILRATQALIADPADWSPRGWGMCGTRCAIHAMSMVVVGKDKVIDTEHDAYQALNRAVGIEWYVGSFNDLHSHAEVMAAFDEAITNEEAREAEHVVTPLPELAKALS